MTKRILLAVTADTSLGLLQGFPERLRDEGWDVHVASSPGPKSHRLAATYGVTFHPVEMTRNPSILGDLRALLAWTRLLRSIRPDLTSVGTPKAGLLAGIASLVARVPRRVYVLRGLRYETSTGVARAVLRSLERVACACAHEVHAVSHSLRDLAVADGLAAREKIVVIGRGSSNGVDVARFTVTTGERRAAKAERWPEGPDVPVIGFIGRIHPDKGLDLLADAVELLAREAVPGRLLVVGGSDSDLGEDLQRRLVDSGFDVEFTGAVDDVAPYLRVMDVLCLPTKREGFPNVVLEAAAAGIPTVATLATGVRDAIRDGETGLICPTRQPEELAEPLRTLVESARTRASMGSAARQFVLMNFDREVVQSNLLAYYGRVLGARRRTASDGDQIQVENPERTYK